VRTYRQIQASITQSSHRRAVALVSTDPAVAAELRDAAAQIGIETTWCSDGAHALPAIGAEPPDVLVIAAPTDTLDAASITSAVRNRWQFPILVGSAAADETAQNALTVGASAVIARPYDLTIAPFTLNTSAVSESEPSICVVGPIHVDRHSSQTQVRGRDIQLTQRELELLIFVIQQQGKVASSEDISRAVWGRASDTITVAVHVTRLREKPGHDAEHGEFIRTIRRAGYRLAPSIYA
jgi:DNA-binding response OmpR family regulator